MTDMYELCLFSSLSIQQIIIKEGTDQLFTDWFCRVAPAFNSLNNPKCS